MAWKCREGKGEGFGMGIWVGEGTSLEKNKEFNLHVS